MQNILLMFNDEMKWFDTVKHAQDYAILLPLSEEFAIYTLHMKGKRSGIEWTPVTDHASNLRAIAKGTSSMKTTTKELRKTAKRSGAWTDTEIKTLATNRKTGMEIQKIATALGRSYNACYSKLQTLKKRGLI